MGAWFDSARDPFTRRSGLGLADSRRLRGHGGAIVEAVVFYGRISTWQAMRHRVLAKGKGRLPPLRRYIDLPSDLLAAVTRLLLGAGAGWLFHSQITGVYAAVAVGASAPALLRQLGAAKSVRGAVEGSSSSEPH